MSEKDALTGVHNYRGLQSKLDELFAEAAQSKQHLTLIMFDLDRFKAFNDAYGHKAGDALIQQVAHTLSEVFADKGIVGRYGGEEFLVVLPSTSSEDALQLAEKARSLIAARESITVEGQVLPCQVSISGGIAAYPLDAQDTKMLIRNTEQELYRAKESGRNCICLYEDKDALTGVLSRNGILREINEALGNAAKNGGSASLISFDVNHFKETNDEFGHRTGDEVLKRIAHILRENFAGANAVGRYGGDEFLVVLPGSRAETAFVLAEEVRRLIHDAPLEVVIGGKTTVCETSVSGGIAAYPTDARERVDLIRKANEALYRAKQSGRHCICLPSSSQMVTKTSHFTQTQLERLAELAKKVGKSEAFLLREALDDLLRKYDESSRAN